jgi:hypothetical protein
MKKVIVVLVVVVLFGWIQHTRNTNQQNAVEVREILEAVAESTKLAQSSSERFATKLPISNGDIGDIERSIKKLEAKSELRFPKLRDIAVKIMKDSQTVIHYRQEAQNLHAQLERRQLTLDEAQFSIKKLSSESDAADKKARETVKELCNYFEHPERSLPKTEGSFAAFKASCAKL